MKNHLRREVSVEGLPRSNWLVAMSWGGFVLIVDWGERPQATVFGASQGHVVQDCIRKLWGESQEAAPLHSLCITFSFLPWVSSLTSLMCKPHELFSLNCFPSWCFITVVEKKVRKSWRDAAWLRALAAFEEDQGFIPSTQRRQLTTSFSSAKLSTALFWHPQAVHSCARIHTQTHQLTQ